MPVSEMPTLANEVVTVTTSTTESVPPPLIVPLPATNQVANINLNISNTQEVISTESDKNATVQVSQPNVNVTTIPSVATTTTLVATTPPKIVQASGQFVQVKPPTTTTGRVQSPNVKNFFIRKGIEKQPHANQIISSPTGTFITTQGSLIASPSGTFITTQGSSTPQMAINQLPSNKKIIIKSQQILVPANSAKANTSINVSGQQTISSPQGSIPLNTSVIDSSSNDLSGILDLPILFADNSDSSGVIDQSTHLLNTSSGSSNILVSTSDKSVTPNMFITTTTDGKLPNRPVVISAAKIKPTLPSTVATTPTTNKVIFINRNQIKQQIVGSQTVSGTQLVKGLPTLKLVPTSLSGANPSTPITLQGGQLTKLSPGTKIDLSTLKLVKSGSPNISGGVMKPLIINKAVQGTKNAIVIKSPIGANVQGHQVIKGNVLNRNITVRKVMNVVPGNVKSIANSPVTVSTVTSSPIQTTTASVSQTTTPVATSTQPKATRKTRNSN